MNQFVHLIKLKYFCSIQACIEVSFSLVTPGSSIKEFVQQALVIQMRLKKFNKIGVFIHIPVCSLKICSQSIL